ncbi:phosphoenolpyruvate synthase [Levilactobacillus brevis]|uniref:phosphoenolpyruvate synthase n=1 Tax=Levilactobacillus brevis TaxID=1580 RepID=UPI001C015137|nr:phosphoenolpyruvate synthase [Levilactobacillus brevis]MBT9676740.1 phosphoenolpyruvate synthase [Levilactobacillus brevis]
MSYVKNKWTDGDVITADKLNNIENGIDNEQVGLTGTPGKDGAPGKDGNSVTAIALTTDTTGKVTGGTATLSDKTTLPITVTQSKV